MRAIAGSCRPVRPARSSSPRSGAPEQVGGGTEGAGIVGDAGGQRERRGVPPRRDRVGRAELEVAARPDLGKERAQVVVPLLGRRLGPARATRRSAGARRRRRASASPGRRARSRDRRRPAPTARTAARCASGSSARHTWPACSRSRSSSPSYTGELAKIATMYGAAALSTRQRSQGSSSKSRFIWNDAVCRIMRAPRGPAARQVLRHPPVPLVRSSSGAALDRVCSDRCRRRGA